MPTAASAKPSIIDTMVLNGGSLPMPTKLQKARKKTAKILRRPELQREARHQRRQRGDHDDGEQRADERGGEGRGERLAGPALLRHRIAVERRGDRPGFAGDVEQDRGDGAAEQRAPVDAGQHDDRRGRRHAEGQRQQDRHAVGPPSPGSTPMITPSTMPTHHQQRCCTVQHDGEAVEQVADVFHRSCLDLFWPSRGS